MQLYYGKDLIPQLGVNDTKTSTYQFRGVAQDPYVFRYFMVVIDNNFRECAPEELKNDLKCMQFSKLQFLNNDGNSFIYPTNNIQTALKGNSTGCVRGEEIKDLLINDNTSTTFGKCCVPSVNAYYPIILWFDLGSECLNLKTFNRWRWYTSGDTNQYPTRNPRDFSLYVSNNGIFDDKYTFWKCIDSYNATEEDYKKWGFSRIEAYTSKKFEI